jgi:FkbM family methyltransferase
MQRKGIRYVSRGSVIEVMQGNLLWTTHRSRAHLYSNGLLERGAAIGKSYLLHYIDFTDGDLVVDCGANMGDLQLWFRNRKINIKYLGIEPNPIDYDCLYKNLLSDSSSLNLALWNKNGNLKFWVDSKSASSSLIEPPYFTEVIKVNSSRFDELEGLGRIKLLKVEGEGAEPEILFGAQKFLKNIQFISADLGPERGVEQMSTRNEVVNFLLENNFTVVIENPYHRKTVLFKNSEYSR